MTLGECRCFNACGRANPLACLATFQQFLVILDGAVNEHGGLKRLVIVRSVSRVLLESHSLCCSVEEHPARLTQVALFGRSGSSHCRT